MSKFTLGIALLWQLQESNQIIVEKSYHLDVCRSVQGKVPKHSGGNVSQRLDHDSSRQKGGLERLWRRMATLYQSS